MATMDGKGDYRRFWALLKGMPGAEKDEIVWQFTGGRTTHLHLMTEDEYGRMLRMMDGIVAGERRALLRKWRSVCLKLMQEIGVDTADWDRVNAFTGNARIAGMAFGEIPAEGLKALAVKLRMIKKKRQAGSPRSEWVLRPMSRRTGQTDSSDAAAMNGRVAPEANGMSAECRHAAGATRCERAQAPAIATGDAMNRVSTKKGNF